MEEYKMKKIVAGTMCMVLFLIAVPLVSADEGPDLDIHIIAGPSFPTPVFKVTNRGDSTAHNVCMTDVTIEGNVLYNNRESSIASNLEPDSFKICTPNSWVIGFGLFSMNITLTCDEGVFVSDTVNGFMIGPVQLIP
jgi:hypothetical protein